MHHYEVGPEVVQMVEQAFGSSAEDFLLREGEKAKFDLWRTNQSQIEDMGVRQIETAGICTACNLEDWFSHRGEKGETGRFGALIALKE
jgi:copper oxidase (laccase) domain-containing protein